MLTQTTRPDGLLIGRTYDAAGKLDFMTTPAGIVDYTYFGLTPCPGCAPGRLASIMDPSGVVLSHAYDGQLLSTMTWSGPFSGSVGFTYDNSFRAIAETVFDLDALDRGRRQGRPGPGQQLSDAALAHGGQQRTQLLDDHGVALGQLVDRDRQREERFLSIFVEEARPGCNRRGSDLEESVSLVLQGSDQGFPGPVPNGVVHVE
jgi:uncharacterized protein RhaS with RHS repeats